MSMSWEEHVALVESGKPGYPIVEVIWEDAAAFAIEWAEKIEIKSRKVTTVGYLVSESDDALSLVQMINTEQVGHGMVIPKSCILSWRDI